jgi:hypothetical protein
MMVPLGDTKIQQVALWRFLVENSFCYSKIDLDHPLWTFMLDGPKLWHVAQSKFATWHINYILGKNNSNEYLFEYVSW